MYYDSTFLKNYMNICWYPCGYGYPSKLEFIILIIITIIVLSIQYHTMVSISYGNYYDVIWYNSKDTSSSPYGTMISYHHHSLVSKLTCRFKFASEKRFCQFSFKILWNNTRKRKLQSYYSRIKETFLELKQPLNSEVFFFFFFLSY
jgi:hypothetical protein